jgi:nitrogen fixation protein NifU and related proteins
LTDLGIYAETLIYAYEHPQHKGQISKAEASMHEENISCGDKITVYLKLENGKVSDVKFDGTGCIISMGSADILTDSLIGKKIVDVLKMSKEDLLGIINIEPGPVRMHCATLSLRAAKKALFAYEKKDIDTATKEL